MRNLKKSSQKVESDHESFYAEVHQIHPPGENGSDKESNLILLCPKHLVVFDYKIIEINPNNNLIEQINNDHEFYNKKCFEFYISKYIEKKRP